MESALIVWIAVLTVVLAVPFVIEGFRPQLGKAERKAAPGRFVTLSGGVTHYQWIGPARGPVAVCVHGLTTPSFVWQSIAAGLARMGFRVLTYDLYGRGYSDRPPGLQSRAFFLRQLEELLADQGIKDDITLLGYSMGGSISTAFASKHPNMLRRLILIAPAGITLSVSPMVRLAKDVPLIGDWLMLSFFPRQHLRATEAEREFPSSVPNIVDLQQAELQWRGYLPAVLSSLRGILDEVQEADHRKLADRDIPVLAIWGEDDRTIPLASLGTLAQWNRKAQQATITGAGHGLAYTHTDDVLDAIEEALG